MAITSAICTSFVSEKHTGVHVFGTDTIKCALYTSSATLGASTTAYSATNEVSGTGYTAGGATLSGVTVNTSGTTVYLDFDDVVWASSTITARGCLIYNSSKSNKAIAVLDFGSDKSTVAADYSIAWPAPAAGTAIIREA